MDKTVYNLLITNSAAYIRSDKNLDDVVEGNGLDAYQAGKALGAALCKDPIEVMNDIVAKALELGHWDKLKQQAK